MKGVTNKYLILAISIVLISTALLSPAVLVVNGENVNASVDNTTNVCMGDSITAGAYLTPHTTYPGILQQIIGGTVINSGIGGQTTAQMVLRFKADALDYHPQYLFLLGGTNDILQGVKAPAIENNLKTMIDAAVAGGAKVFLLMIPPDNHFSGLQNRVRTSVNTWIAGQASANVIIVDIATPLADSGKQFRMNPQFHIGDGEHPNAEGMSVIAQTIIKKGQTLGYFGNVNFWTGGANTLASNALNWEGTKAPVAGDNIVFSREAIRNCVLDQPLTYGSITLLPGYTATVTQAANIGSVRNQSFLSGTINGSPGFTDTCGGDFIQYGAVITTNVLNLVMTGDNKILQASSFNFYDLTLSNTNIRYDYTFVLHDLTIRPGAVVALDHYGGLVWMPIDPSDLFVNGGTITGTGDFHIWMDGTSVAATLGPIQVPTTVTLVSWAYGSSTMTLTADCALSSVTIQSWLYPPYTCTLNLNGHSIGTTNVVLGIGGALLQ